MCITGDEIAVTELKEVQQEIYHDRTASHNSDDYRRSHWDDCLAGRSVEKAAQEASRLNKLYASFWTFSGETTQKYMNEIILN